GTPVRIAVATFIPPSASSMPGYTMVASPTLYPGQIVTARICSRPGHAEGHNPIETEPAFRLFVRVYNGVDQLELSHGPMTPVPHLSGLEQWRTLEWRIP